MIVRKVAVRFASTGRVPLVFGQVLDRPRTHWAAAGIRDHDVGRTEVLLDGVSHPLDVVEARDIRGNGNCFASRRDDLLADRVDRCRITAVDRDPRSFVREANRDRSTDATRAPRDEGDPADERAHDGAPGVPAMKLYWIAAMRQSPSSRTIVNPTRTSGGVG